MAFVRSILLAYERYGINPASALSQAQITPRQARDPHGRINALQMEAICSAAMQELDDEALGWFSRKLPWGTHGMLCRASLTSPDLGIALRRWCRHYRLLHTDIGLHLEVHGAVAHLRIDEATALGAMREFCLVTNLRYVHGFACWAIDSRIPLLGASFPFAAPPHAEAYPLMFRGPLQFDAAEAGFSFDAQYLALPLRRDERALQTMLRRALPVTVLQYRRDRLLVQRVQDLLEAPASASAPASSTADALASALNVSVRTLHRQLQEQGASLQSLKDQVRRDQASLMLRRGQRPIKQIAQAVGFGSEKSFARAFRLWTGQSPSAFRRDAGSSAAES